MKLRELQESEVQFSVEFEPYDHPVEEGMDPELVEQVKKRLADGDWAAWCEATVTATWQGVTVEVYLCGVILSEDYKGEQIDKAGVLEQLKPDALDQLNEKLQEQFDKLRLLVTK